MNKSDSERISFYLENFGFKKAQIRKKSDLIIINTCGIRQTAEDRVYGLIMQIKKDNPKVKIILTGCLRGREDVQRRLKKHVDIWLNITELPELYMKLNDLFSLDMKDDKGFDEDYLEMGAKINSKFSAFIPIGNGCNNFCSYCVVPYARGREKYRNAYNIVREVKGLIEKNYKEVILIAQNVNSYIFEDNDKKIDFPDLLEMVNEIEGDFWIKFATSHPKDMSDKLIYTISKNKKICDYIHLPVQSGNDMVLKNMNRKYTIKHYLGLIKKIKKNIPNVAITTDVIVGFPWETNEQFLCTAELFEKVKFDMAYIAKYSPRPGTKANEMEDNIEGMEKKNREEKLVSILEKTALENNKKYLNKIYKVLLEDKDKNKCFLGRTETNKRVKIINSAKLKNNIGEFVEVEITSVDNFGLGGKIICQKKI